MKDNKFILRCKDYFNSFILNNKLITNIITLSLFISLILIANIIYSSYCNYMNTNLNTFSQTNMIITNLKQLNDDDYKYIDLLLINSKATYIKGKISSDEKYEYLYTGVTKDFIDTGIYTNVYGKLVIKKLDIIYGDLFKEKDKNVSLISRKSAEKLFNSNPINKTLITGSFSTKIVGIFEDYQELEESQIDLITKFDNVSDDINPYTIIIDSKDKAKLKMACDQYFQKNGYRVNLVDYDSSISEINTYINNFRLVYCVVIIFLLIILFIGINNAIIYNVKSKSFEIALRKSLGAKDSDVFKRNIFESISYIILAYILALFSTIIIFLIIQILISFFKSEIPFLFKIDLLDQIYLVILFLCISILSSIYPTIFITKQNLSKQFQNE